MIHKWQYIDTSKLCIVTSLKETLYRVTPINSNNGKGHKSELKSSKNLNESDLKKPACVHLV